jgi:hypothetical protein
MFCYWPRTNISFRARKAEIPDKEKWAKYPVRILHYTGEHYMYEYYDGLKSCLPDSMTCYNEKRITVAQKKRTDTCMHRNQ